MHLAPRELDKLLLHQVGVLAQKREIRDLDDIVGKLEHELALAMQKLVTAKTELKQVGNALDGLRTQVHEGDVYHMGELEIQGLDARTTARLVEGWKLRGGDVFAPRKFRHLAPEIEEICREWWNREIIH